MENLFYYQLSIISHENTAGSHDNYLNDKSHKVQYIDPVIRNFLTFVCMDDP